MPTRIRPAVLRIATISILALTAAGCATVPPSERTARDPWQRVNRGVYRFNDVFDRAIAAPVARGYVRAVPHVVRTGVTNFFNNATYPVVIVNALLQGQPGYFARDIGRFVMNSTVGIGGILDPASRVGLPLENRDFGQTFGKWGIPTGPYLVLPFLGPSDVRDALGRVPDTYAEPWAYIQNPYWDYGTLLLDEVTVRAALLPLTDMAQKTFDPYAFERNAYLQQRKFMVNGAQAQKNQAEDELKELQQDSGGPPP
ncbi:MAG TPA: VacJ family lipoprotein [Steroidobacteraceae bacterium]|nr:VacJ family lipoprotein [Steroidobacteraceae bacterium]